MASTWRGHAQPTDTDLGAALPSPSPRRLLRPDQSPDARQRDEARAELHAVVDLLCDAWPTIQRQARDMGRGIASTTGGDGGSGAGGTHSDPTARVALEARPDPAQRALEALAEFAEFRAMARNVERRVRGLLPASEEMVPRGRQNDVENCGDCHAPIVGKVRRIDGVPLHASSCYYRVHRSRA